MSEALTLACEERSGVRHENVFGTPHPALRGHVRTYTGYASITPGVARRTHSPSGIVPLIITLGPQIGVVERAQQRGPATYIDAFMAGMHDVYAVSESKGEASGIQIDFTPLSAHLLLGRDMSDLTNRIVSLDDVFGVEGPRLRDRLMLAPRWAERFQIVDEFIMRRLATAKPASPAVAWAWGQLVTSGGATPVSELAREIGWSRKHLAARFREQVGLPPKTVARILRFERAQHTIRDGIELGWSDLAARCGYYDQAHLIRDFREFAGLTPGEYVARRLPDGLED